MKQRAWTSAISLSASAFNRPRSRPPYMVFGRFVEHGGHLPKKAPDPGRTRHAMELHQTATRSCCPRIIRDSSGGDAASVPGVSPGAESLFDKLWHAPHCSTLEFDATGNADRLQHNAGPLRATGPAFGLLYLNDGVARRESGFYRPGWVDYSASPTHGQRSRYGLWAGASGTNRGGRRRTALPHSRKAFRPDAFMGPRRPSGQ